MVARRSVALYGHGMAKARPVRLTAKMAAERAGVKLGTWTAYVARDQAPKPDGTCDPCGCSWWWSSSVDDYMANRPGQGARTDLVSH